MRKRNGTGNDQELDGKSNKNGHGEEKSEGNQNWKREENRNLK